VIGAVDISESLHQGIDDLIGLLPTLIGFLLILLVGCLVAKALQKVVALALENVSTDRALESGTAGRYVGRSIDAVDTSADDFARPLRRAPGSPRTPLGYLPAGAVARPRPEVVRREEVSGCFG
jgi:hypothetical protein